MTVSIQTPKAWLARSGAAVVISLQAIKDDPRVAWDATRTPTGASLERLLRAKLGPSDRFVQIDELHWLVVMPDTAMEDALSCCLRIAYQLHTAIIPSCDLGRLKIFSAAATGGDVLELTLLADEQFCAVVHRAGLDGALTAIHEAPDETPEWRRFEPVWDVQRQVVSRYRSLIEGPTGAGETVGQQLKRTQAMLVGTARVLERRLAERARCKVLVPIPYDVLSAPPARMELLSTCRQLKCYLRPLLVFEIATLPAGIPKHRLAEIVSAIQPFARAVIARATPRNRSLIDYGGTGLKALGLELTSQSGQAEIEGLFQAGKRLGMTTYLGNVGGVGALEQAIARDVQWISGPVIGKPVSEPVPSSELALDTILQTVDPPEQQVG